MIGIWCVCWFVFVIFVIHMKTITFIIKMAKKLL